MKKTDIVVVISFILCTIIMIIFKFAEVDAAEWKQVTIAECKGNTSAYIYRNGILRKEWEDIYEKQRADYESRTESTVDDVIEGIRRDGIKDIFGYIPSEWEIILLKKAITAECGYSEPDKGIVAVLSVIANRCRRDGKSIREVLSSPGQFETWSNGRVQSSGISEQVERVTSRVFDTGRVSDRRVLYFTAGQYNPYCKPGYVIGNHYFGYRK